MANRTLFDQPVFCPDRVIRRRTELGRLLSRPSTAVFLLLRLRFSRLIAAIPIEESGLLDMRTVCAVLLVDYSNDLEVLAWRANDGFSASSPAFTGGAAVGQWRPTAPAF